ncbi:MAG: hypothetical protein Q8R02_18845 [Hyphomonadaceae bacterium]|nr:hypothetical protein [Hyphomonadaceae bacterium]
MRALRIGVRPSFAEWLTQVLPGVLTILWILAGVALYFSSTWLVLRYGIDLSTPFLAHMICGCVLLFLLLVMFAFGRRDASALLPVTIVALMTFYFGDSVLRRLGDQVAFQIVRAPFDQAVAVAYAPRDRPVFIAFPWTSAEAHAAKPLEADEFGNPIAASRAIVYDEKDAIDGANIYTWRQRSPHLAEAINGKPQRCIRFAAPHYYLCSFSSFS